jgi:teichuronic acid biosynthesis glycosyltransferase TuaC
VAEVDLSGRRILFVSNRWPDRDRPWHGIHMKKQAESLEALGAEIDVVPIRGYASSRAYVSALAEVAALNRRRYDLVHAHYGLSGVVARAYARAPLVLSYLGTDLLGVLPESGVEPRYRSEARLYSRFSRWTAATITQSEQMEGLLPPRARARNAVIAEGVDMSMFRPMDQADCRRELGWPADERVVLFVSDPARPVKNYPLAERACRRAAARQENLRLRVAADVTPDEVPVWMNASDALILTSRYEGGPSTVKEAMACELPVVSVPVGIVREALSGLPGLWIAPPEEEALADALVAALAAGRVPAARQAIEIMSLETVAQRVAAVYERVLDS